MTDSVMEIDQKFSDDCQIPCALEHFVINEKPRPNIDLLLKKPTTWKRRAKDDWPPLVIDALENWPRPSRQSSPKNSSPSPNSSPKVARHRKQLRPKRLNFDF